MSAMNYREQIENIKKDGRYRRLRAISGAQGPELIVDGRKAICLCSNNYLGLAGHPALAEAQARAARELGVGAGASRLISGNMDIHARLEERIAHFKGIERVLLFSSGYQANVGVISALVGRGDFIYSDQFNHASIVDGARLSRAEIRVYPHRDTEALERMIAGDDSKGRKLIVTDSVFSMDGDLAPLDAIVKIKNRHGAMLMIDEAHATGVMGTGGKGLAVEMGCAGEIDVTMGTLGKALGGFGAFVGGSAQLVDYLINTARSFIFTTALPPSLAASALAAFDVIEAEPQRIKRLLQNVKILRKGMQKLGLNVPQGETPIIPLIIGDERKTMDICERLLDRGIFVQGIRPPTVPPDASRLRITVMSRHTKEHLERAIEAFKSLRSVIAE